MGFLTGTTLHLRELEVTLSAVRTSSKCDLTINWTETMQQMRGELDFCYPCVNFRTNSGDKAASVSHAPRWKRREKRLKKDTASKFLLTENTCRPTSSTECVCSIALLQLCC